MTLIEVVVVIGLYTLLTAAIYTTVQILYQTNNYSSAQSNEIENARRGLTRLTRDLREMTYGEDGTFPVAEKNPHVVGFYSDIDKDNSVEYVRWRHQNRLRYFLNMYKILYRVLVPSIILTPITICSTAPRF
jgi:type II secretion system protein J